MGRRDPNRWPREEWRRTARTVELMIAGRWDVLTVCNAANCRLTMRADLKLIRYVKGPDFELWNRTMKCKRVGCTGIVAFWGKPPEVDQHFPLAAAWPE